MVLEDIVTRKRREVARRKQETSVESLRARCQGTVRSFREALRRPQTSFILECKKSSPSQGLIRADFDLEAIAHTYAPYASAISVLTDDVHFGGSLANLAVVRAQVRQPVLCKDFVVDPFQIVEARALGADSILLMASVLNDSELQTCLGICRDLGMEPLLEIHDEDELARALALDAPVIGINNRNLKTLVVDLDTTARLAPRVPRERVLVCESGIRNHADVVRFRNQVDAFLVGTSLMKEPDLDAAVRALVFGRVKICGLRRVEDARAAREAGASWGGMIFFAGSPRHVTPEDASALAAGVEMPWVGVFVNEAAERVAETARRLRLAAVQLHGNENAAFVERLRPLLPHGTEVWKALKVRDALPELAGWQADRLLLDTWDSQKEGGSGRTFDWHLLARQADSLILAGGLAPENIPTAEALGTWALDVNSGVEDAPGRKSPQKIAALFATLRGHREMSHAP